MAHVLIVDDQLDGCEAIASYLAKAGHTVRCLTSGRAAIDVTVYPSAVVFDRPVATLNKGNSVDFAVLVTPVLPPNTYSPFALSVHTALTFTISTSRAEVGTLKASSLTIAAGESQASATFTAASSGSTTLWIVQPPGSVQANPPAEMVIVVN